MSAPRRPPPAFVRRSRGGGIAGPERRTGQPQGGSALAEAARRTGLSEQEVLDLALARSAWRTTVIAHLGTINDRVSWARTPLPAVNNIHELSHLAIFSEIDKERVLWNDSAPTALERADGNWGPAVRRLCNGAEGVNVTVAALTAAFNRYLGPAVRQPRTRADYRRAWRLVVTWAVARKAVKDILPMKLDTLKALTWDLVCFHVPSSQIELVWKAVQSRHRLFQLRPPLCEANQYSSWVRMLGSIRGRPIALKLPIQKSTVRWLLAWRPSSVADHRARLMTALATIACLRVNEVARLQVCDLWFDHLTSYGVPGFQGTCSVHVDRRKNDTVRKGHYPALGRSVDPALDLVTQLRTWLTLPGLAVHPQCAKRIRPAARCELCAPLFPTTRCAKGGVTVPTMKACSRNQVREWIREAVGKAGGDRARFSGISARKGGISTAIDAGVDETILYLQSGHGQPLPARAYMQLSSPARFLETFEAFGL